MTVAACACAGASVFLYAVNPNQSGLYPPCLLYKVTGFYCAGCGATRALYALLHGRLLEALHDNALFITTLPLGLGFVLPYLIRSWRADTWLPIPVKGKPLLRRGIAAVSLVLAFSVMRNLPGWPFDLLKPLAVLSS